jgi:hypothetical protein
LIEIFAFVLTTSKFLTVRCYKEIEIFNRCTVFVLINFLHLSKVLCFSTVISPVFARLKLELLQRMEWYLPFAGFIFSIRSSELFTEKEVLSVNFMHSTSHFFSLFTYAVGSVHAEYCTKTRNIVEFINLSVMCISKPPEV